MLERPADVGPRHSSRYTTELHARQSAKGRSVGRSRELTTRVEAGSGVEQAAVMTPLAIQRWLVYLRSVNCLNVQRSTAGPAHKRPRGEGRGDAPGTLRWSKPKARLAGESRHSPFNAEAGEIVRVAVSDRRRGRTVYLPLFCTPRNLGREGSVCTRVGGRRTHVAHW